MVGPRWPRKSHHLYGISWFWCCVLSVMCFVVIFSRSRAPISSQLIEIVLLTLMVRVAFPQPVFERPPRVGPQHHHKGTFESEVLQCSSPTAPPSTTGRVRRAIRFIAGCMFRCRGGPAQPTNVLFGCWCHALFGCQLFARANIAPSHSTWFC